MPDDNDSFSKWPTEYGFDEDTDLETLGLGGWGGENKVGHQAQSDDDIPSIDTNSPVGWGGENKVGHQAQSDYDIPSIDTNSPVSGGLMQTFKNGMSSVESWIKDNKELATMIGSGIAGAVRDKNQREMSQAQIDYMKQRQADLNASITPYDLGAALKRRGKA